ncbi:MAG: GNAT family N-acetyltransferase [Chloroflexi bacterium]|nr:GNAT family N-acetyltransferase [Chloroflexota bacterium]
MIRQHARLLIRGACADDLDTLSRLITDAYEEYRGSLPAWAWEEYVRDITDIRRRMENGEVIVAEIGGRLAGTITFYPDGRLTEEGWPEGWASVRVLAVHPDVRGIGVGRGLMEECFRRCRERGIRTVGLHTSRLMVVARDMYLRMGFQSAPQYDFRPAPDIVVEAFRLDL